MHLPPLLVREETIIGVVVVPRLLVRAYDPIEEFLGATH
jgi:hypothetical protein